jgi:hypothetical protein
MKKLALICNSLLAALSLTRAAGANPDPAGSALLQAAQPVVAAYHAGQPPATNRLHVVYFVPKDAAPITNYAARLDRVMTDVSNFYRDAFQRFGLTGTGLPLERQDGRVVIRLVQGKQPASHYSYESGGETAAEIHEALAGTLDTEREFILVFYALCQQTDDGRYLFNAPYYGSGSPASGICHAADCELLDPLLLCETNRGIVYTEHYYPRMEQTVAQFNTCYLGGVAHELGHCFGLPHDDGNRAEQSFGISLIGGGNRNYREELWGGGPPVYLPRASVLRLLSHPLFTGSNRGRWEAVKPCCDSLAFSATNGFVRIEGAITDTIPAYATVAYLWPDQSDDHGERTFTALVHNGRFTLDLVDEHINECQRFRLILAALHANGAATTESFVLDYPATPSSLADLNSERTVGRAELAIMTGQPAAGELVSDAAINSAPTPEAARQLRALRAVLDPAPPFDLTTFTGNRAVLSDAAWTDAEVGWGNVARNHYWFDSNIHDGVLFRLAGQFFEKGLYAHANSRYVFPLTGQWKTFTAVIGLQEGADNYGSVIFTVRGDGRELYRSPLLRVGQTENVKVDVSQVKELELRADGGEGNNHCSWAVWAQPVVLR